MMCLYTACLTGCLKNASLQVCDPGVPGSYHNPISTSLLGSGCRRDLRPLDLKTKYKSHPENSRSCVLNLYELFVLPHADHMLDDDENDDPDPRITVASCRPVPRNLPCIEARLYM